MAAMHGARGLAGALVVVAAVHISAVAHAADGMRPAMHQEETVTERIQWGGANACACPAVHCAFMNGLQV